METATNDLLKTLFASLENPLSPLTQRLILCLIFSFLGHLWYFHNHPPVADILSLESTEQALAQLEHITRIGLLGLGLLLFAGLCRLRQKKGFIQPGLFANCLLGALIALVWTLPQLRQLHAQNLTPPMAPLTVQVTQIVPQERTMRQMRSHQEPYWSKFWQIKLAGPGHWQDTLKIAVSPDPDRRPCEWLAQVKTGEKLSLSLQSGLLGGLHIASLGALSTETQRPACDRRGVK